MLQDPTLIESITNLEANRGFPEEQGLMDGQEKSANNSEMNIVCGGRKRQVREEEFGRERGGGLYAQISRYKWGCQGPAEARKPSPIAPGPKYILKLPCIMSSFL